MSRLWERRCMGGQGQREGEGPFEGEDEESGIWSWAMNKYCICAVLKGSPESRLDLHVEDGCRCCFLRKRNFFLTAVGNVGGFVFGFLVW